MEHISQNELLRVFELLDGRLRINGAPQVSLVVCGGASLLGTGLLVRTTRDVDILALRDDAGNLVAPVPLPDYLAQAAQEVAETLNLARDWLNNGPSRDEGGLLQLGLPSGLQDRLLCRPIGERLTVYFISRLDQIHFKLYAAVDCSGGRHQHDLIALNPTGEEMERAARWTMTHDVSDEFRALLLEMLRTLGYGNVAARI
jgi:hypothetical protein